MPDIYHVYSSWKAKVHPDVELLRQHLEGYFEKFVSTESVRRKQRKVDAALCTGHFWTHVAPEKFLVLGELVAWVGYNAPVVNLANKTASSFSGMTKSTAAR